MHRVVFKSYFMPFNILFSRHACGENPDRVYGQTRMDGQWDFRQAYDKARQIRDAQDAFCARAVAGEWAALEAGGAEFPEELQWESLVDVLRGRVKVGSLLSQ